MIISISRRKAVGHAKFLLIILVVLFLLLLLLPKFLSEVWQLNSFPKNREEQYMERPLRVISNTVNNL
ncbi:MAG: hypothetical protein H6Q67_36 [Firmicutes bacterium]|nr:hypothetical protein [Bacillota bacterium]